MTHNVLAPSAQAIKQSIMERILVGPNTSRKEISRTLGIRPNTVSDYVNQLVEADLVWEHRQSTGGRGRPTITLLPNSNRLVCIVFQIVSRTVVASIINISGQVLTSQRATLETSAGNKEITGVFQQLLEECQQLLEPSSINAGVLFSLPGIMDAQRNLGYFALVSQRCQI